MAVQQIYTDESLPDGIKCQVLSFIRIQWPDGFKGKNRYRDWITKPEHHPLHFVLIEKNNLLVSYVGVVWKYLDHLKVKYKIFGLSGVFTYPQFRNKGYGLRLVKEAKNYIDQADGDIALITTGLKGFYERAGFQYMENVKVLEGNLKKPRLHDEYVYMLFLSSKGQSGKKDFEAKPVYFGETVW